MKRLGEHPDNWAFYEIQFFKKGKGRVSSRAGRKQCKVIARAEKHSEKQRAMKEAQE